MFITCVFDKIITVDSQKHILLSCTKNLPIMYASIVLNAIAILFYICSNYAGIIGLSLVGHLLLSLWTLESNSTIIILRTIGHNFTLEL